MSDFSYNVCVQYIAYRLQSTYLGLEGAKLVAVVDKKGEMIAVRKAKRQLEERRTVWMKLVLQVGIEQKLIYLGTGSGTCDEPHHSPNSVSEETQDFVDTR